MQLSKQSREYIITKVNEKSARFTKLIFKNALYLIDQPVLPPSTAGSPLAMSRLII